MENHAATWHPEVITAATKSTLSVLRNASILDKFYLARGTGLALQLGHRLSQDLDFFASDLFDAELLLQQLQGLRDLTLVAKEAHTLHTTMQGTRVTFLGYKYPLLFPFTRFQEVAVADPREIACTKLSATAGRGTKRDFIDLYLCVRKFGLARILEWFDGKYAQSHYNKLHLLKSLTFFDDAEKDPMPHMLVPLAWDEVKQFFSRDVPQLLR